MSHLYDTDGVITADYFEGHDNLITLNHSSTQVQEYVREVMLHWLRPVSTVGGWTPRMPYRRASGPRCCRWSARSSPTPGSSAR